MDEKLIPLTVPEVRRLLYRLIWRHQPTDESVLRWSRWRRRHQATAPALPLPTPPETPHHISATVVLEDLGATLEAGEIEFRARSRESRISRWA